MDELAQPSHGNDLPAHLPALLDLFGRNTFWLWMDRGVLSVGTLLAGLILVRYLGPHDYGLYSVALSIGVLTASVADIGLTRYAARTVAASPEEGSGILAAGLFVSAFVLLGQLGALAIASLLGNWFAVCLCTGLILGNLQRTATLAATFLTAELRSQRLLAGSVVARAGSIAVIGVVAWQHLSVRAALLASTLIWLPVVATRLWQIRHHFPTTQQWNWKTVWGVGSRAWPFFSYSLTQIGYEQVSIACFSLVATQEQVGQFAAAAVIANVFPQWTFASSDALLPVMTRLFEARRIGELLSVGQRVLDVLLILSLPVVVLLGVFAPEVCGVLGTRFAASALALRILAGRSFFSVLAGLFGEGLVTASNHMKDRTKALAKVLLLLVVLTLVLGQVWGVAGAAAALLVSSFVMLVQYMRISAGIGLRLNWASGLGPCLVAGLAMLGASIAFSRSLEWMLAGAVALAVYFGVLGVVNSRQLTSAWRTLRECMSGALALP